MLLTREAREEAIRKYGKKNYLTKLMEDADRERDRIRAEKGLLPISKRRITELTEELKKKEAREWRQKAIFELRWCKDHDMRPALNHHIWTQMTEAERKAYRRGCREMFLDSWKKQ